MGSAIWGFIGTLVGALASLGTTWVTTRNTLVLQASTANIEREDRFRIFQRDTFLALQDALHDLMRLVAQAHLEDILAYRETREWGKNYLSDAVSEGQRLAARKFSILVQRVADDQARYNLKNLNGLLSEVGLASSEQITNAKWQEAIIKCEQNLETLGELLRRQY